MEITFAIRGQDGAALDEAQARAALDAGQLPSDEPYLSGWVRCRHADQSDLDFEDDLSMLFPDCLGLAAALRTNGRGELCMASYFRHYTLIAEDNTVHVYQKDADVNGEVAHYPKNEMIEALAACCGRFAAYAEALTSLDPRWTRLCDIMSEATN